MIVPYGTFHVLYIIVSTLNDIRNKNNKRVALATYVISTVLTLSPRSGPSPATPWVVISLSIPPSFPGVMSTAVGPAHGVRNSTFLIKRDSLKLNNLVWSRDNIQEQYLFLRFSTFTGEDKTVVGISIVDSDPDPDPGGQKLPIKIYNN